MQRWRDRRLRDLLVRAVLNGFHDFSFVKRLLPVTFNTFFFFISHCRLKRANNLYLIQYGCSCKIAILPVNSFISTPPPLIVRGFVTDSFLNNGCVCVFFARGGTSSLPQSESYLFFIIFFLRVLPNFKLQLARRSKITVISVWRNGKREKIRKWSCSTKRRGEKKNIFKTLIAVWRLLFTYL